LHHKAPHRNWMPPLEYINEYNDKVELPDNFYDNYEGRAALQRQLTSVKEGLDIRYDSKIPCDTCKTTKVNSWAPAEFQREIQRLTPEERRVWDEGYKEEYEQFLTIKGKDELLKWQFQRYMEDYLRCVKSVDDNVGRVLKYLDEKGLAENTIVVYMSDQGFYLGEHGLYDKRFMYEESFRTPMLFRFPNEIPKNQKIDEYVLNLDIAPTLLDFAGIKVPEDMQGAAMKSLLKTGEAKNWREEIYYHYYEKSFGSTAHFGIRTERYKLIHFYDPINSWELYDLKKDPSEMNNLYNDTKYKNIVQNLKDKLKTLQKEYKDEQGQQFLSGNAG